MVLAQPKLVINGIELLRNASSDMGCTDGSSYHDALLLQLVNNSLTQGSFPVILVSSDRYTIRWSSLSLQLFLICEIGTRAP